MAEENQSQFFTTSRRATYEPSKSSSNKKRIIFIFIGVLILLGLVGYAIFATGGQGEENLDVVPSPTISIEPSPTTEPTPAEEEQSPTPSPATGKTSPTPTGKISGTPTPTPKVGTTTEFERSDLSIIVKNGSGIAGAATKASDALKKLGYDVVSSGNADNFDYEGTTIQVTSTKKNFLEMLKTDLAKTYTITSATSDYKGTDADAIVIIGKE